MDITILVSHSRPVIMKILSTRHQIHLHLPEDLSFPQEIIHGTMML